MANENWPVYGEITGPVVMIGFGSIGRGTLPLIERLIAEGYTGRKGKGGFYRVNREKNKAREAIDLGAARFVEPLERIAARVLEFGRGALRAAA